MKKNLKLCFFIFIFFTFHVSPSTFDNIRIPEISSQKVNDFFHEKPLLIFTSDMNNLKQTNENQNFIINGAYKPASVTMVKNILKRYKEIPGGITLEGNAKGIPSIFSINFIKPESIFLINNSIHFNPELSANEIKDIFSSIYKDDNLGVSIGTKNIVYGNLNNHGIVPSFLNFADHFLGAIVFASAKWTSYHSLPNNYKPKRDFTPLVNAVYFNFYDCIFSLNENTINLKSINMDATLIPLLPDEIKSNEYNPDYSNIEKGIFSKPFEDNIKHIINNISFYANDSRLKKVISYAKTASFARFLKENKINFSDIFKK